MTTAFQFSAKPVYNKKKINYKKAYLKNILRSFVVGKLRYLKRINQYNKMKNSFKNINLKELAEITAIARPGKLN